MTRAVNIAQSGGNNVTMRNRIINGGMMIDQRNNGASSTWTGSNTIFIADRFTVSLFGTTYSNPAITAQQATDAPSGFTNSIKVTSSSTITPDANKLGCWMQQIVEGFNSADLAWGTASASPVTISFRVKASKTGNVSVSIENASTARSYVTTVAISAAGTWETKTVTIPGDASGTWDTTNGVGLSVKFGVMSNGSWLAGAGGSWSGTRAVLSTSQTNFIAASGDYIAFTGVQLEAGTTATPFEQRLYGTELALCQRYFYKLGGISVYDIFAPSAVVISSTAIEGVISFPVQMRSTPTGTYANALSNYAWANASAFVPTAITFDLYSLNNARVNSTISGGTANTPAYLRANASTSAAISFSAEL